MNAMKPLSPLAPLWLLLLLAATPAIAQEGKDPSPGVPSGFGRAAAATGGPDVFGYTWADQDEDGCGLQMVDISSTGTLVDWGFGGSDDNASGAIALSATFNFYGNDLTELSMSTNGYLSSDPDDTGTSLGTGIPPSMCPLPDALLSGGGARMYPFLDDLVTDTAYVQYFADCPRPSDRCRVSEDCTIFLWNDTRHFGGVDTFDVEAILYHDTYDVVLNVGAGNPELGAASTTGIQAAPSTPGPPYPTDEPGSGLTYACDTADSIPDDTAVCFFHPDPIPDACVFSDLVIDKVSDAGMRVPVGTEVVYTVTVENDGPDDARNATVTDILDDGVSYVSDDCGAGPPSGSTWTWTEAVVPVSGLVACNVTVEVVGSPGGSVDNTASVRLDNFDPDLVSNTSDTVSFQIGPFADLGIDKQVEMLDEVGRAVVYSLAVSNAGPDELTDVAVTDELPIELVWVSDDCGAGPPSGTTLTWNVGTLASGGSLTCEATFELSPFVSGTFVNTATADAVRFDTVSGNDQSSAEITVAADPAAVFGDGFESGDTSAWDAAVGGS